jgi:hypothetical protein
LRHSEGQFRTQFGHIQNIRKDRVHLHDLTDLQHHLNWASREQLRLSSFPRLPSLVRDPRHQSHSASYHHRQHLAYTQPAAQDLSQFTTQSNEQGFAIKHQRFFYTNL